MVRDRHHQLGLVLEPGDLNHRDYFGTHTDENIIEVPGASTDIECQGVADLYQALCIQRLKGMIGDE